MKKYFYIILFLFITNAIFANSRGYLGIAIKDFSGTINGVSYDGAVIKNVMDESAAKSYGLLENDIIISIDQLKIRKTTDLTTYLKGKDWGEVVTLSYFRDNTLQSKKIFLGYKKDKKTYTIKFVSMDKGVEKWLFVDENKYFYIDSDLNPVKLTAKIEDAEDVLWTNNQKSLNNIDAEIEDKQESIKSIKENKEANNACTCRNVILVKTIVNKENNEAEKAEVIDTEDANIEIFPNPTFGKINISLKDIEQKINIINVFDVAGNLVISQNNIIFEGNSLDLDLSKFAKGLYLVQINTNKLTHSRQIVLQ